MTKDDIIRMAREVGLPPCAYSDYGDQIGNLESFAKLVAAAEREACAKVCDDWQNSFEIDTRGWWASSLCAAGIRERGQA